MAALEVDRFGWAAPEFQFGPEIDPDSHGLHEELRLRRGDFGRTTGLESAAMENARAELSERVEVLLGRVTFVVAKAVSRKLLVIFEHQAIARNFGENARRGDGETFRVAIDEWRLRIARGENVRAVDERVV